MIKVEKQQTVASPIEPVVINAEMARTDPNMKNHTKNGEITLNTVTGEYTVWSECYSQVVCKTQYPKVAEAALEVYVFNYI